MNHDSLSSFLYNVLGMKPLNFVLLQCRSVMHTCFYNYVTPPTVKECFVFLGRNHFIAKATPTYQ